MEEALYEIASLHQFAQLTLLTDIPDETTSSQLPPPGTIVDATINHAPTSTKNASRARDPEMHQTKKGNQWYFGMKAHIAMGATTTFVVSPNAGHGAVMSGTCGGVLAGNVYTTAPIVANCTVIANFVADVYQVTPSAGTNGSISPSAVQNVSHGATRQFSITPSSGYSVVMSGSCGGVLSGSVYTTNPVSGNCTVIATFELIDLFKNGFE